MKFANFCSRIVSVATTLLFAGALGLSLLPSTTTQAVGDSPRVYAGSSTISEGSSGTRNLFFPVTLSLPATSTVKVKFAIVANSASAGSDYTTKTGTLSFPVSLKTGLTPVYKTIAVAVKSDTTVEPEEYFSLVLSSPSAGLTIGRSVGFGTIIDDDSALGVQVAVGDSLVYEGDTATGRTAKVALTLNVPAATTTKVSYTLDNGSASGAQDYKTSAKKTVSFLPGQVQKYILVNLYADITPEVWETALIHLVTPVGMTIGRSTGTIGILDDDNGIITDHTGLFNYALIYNELNDGYTLDGDLSNTVISAPSSNTGGNTRMVYWPKLQTATVDGVVCSEWLSQSTPMPIYSHQQGIALRVTTNEGVTKALTVTKNVFGLVNNQFNVHTFDTSKKQTFTYIGGKSLLNVLGENSALADLPWKVCAKVEGATLSFKVWKSLEVEPDWSDSEHAMTVALPAGWVYAGNHGNFVGHLHPGDSMSMSLN